jgi:hypothetical protein
MSDKLKHKMQVWELTPPVAAWQAIASRLQDDEQHAGLTQRFEQLEITPPANLFNSITERLADDQFYQPISEKMTAAAITPPSGNWQAIAERLNIPAEHTQLADKLYPHHVTPPADSWNKVAAALENNTTQTPVVKLKTAWYKYAVAAALIGIIATSVLLFTNTNSSNPKNNVAVISTPATANPVKPNNSNRIPAANLLANKTQTPAVYVYNKQAGEAEDISYATVAAIHSIAENPIIINSPLIRDETGAVIRDIEAITMHGNYLMVTGPNGQPTRISSKFSNILGYLTGGEEDTEEGIDRIMKESSLWKKRFQQWRKKISQSQFSPSGGNFLDIEAFKELIKEEQ